MKQRQARKQKVSSDLEENRQFLADEIGLEDSFDITAKEFRVAGRDALLVGVDAFMKEETYLYIISILTRLSRDDILPSPIASLFERFVGNVECEIMNDMYDAADQILAGPAILFLDGESKCIAIDARVYPEREVAEPDLERVMRGPRDGFVETLVHNVGLLRRRVRDYSLRTEYESAGSRSQTDIAICYLEDIANPETVERVRESIQQIDIDALPMGERTVAEFLTPWHSDWNPFPVVRYTERPDMVAVYLFEGHVAVMVDGSPAVLLLPVTVFHHLQHAEEFHESVINGTFIRWARYLAVLVAWLGIPLWVMFSENQHLLPEALKFIGPEEEVVVPLVAQFIIAEFGMEFIRMGLIHTPTALGASLGIIGAVLLGELAVEVGLFASEAILYVAIAVLAYFALPSWELGVALRLFRLIYLVVLALTGPIGFGIAVVLTIVVMITTRSWDMPYLWPLIPPDWSGLGQILYRRPGTDPGKRPRLLKPGDRDRGPG